MGRKKRREPLDWSRSIEDHPSFGGLGGWGQSSVGDGASAGIGIFGLFQNDLDAEHKVVQRCPKCRRHMMHKLTPEQKKLSPSKSNWVCINCGNDTDEFGNLL